MSDLVKKYLTDAVSEGSIWWGEEVCISTQFLLYSISVL